jgi:ubiquinone/menaquinone biosynthesis C-methylase UbiE
MEMKTIQPRIPEGGAIEDSQEMTMEQYSEIMKTKLGGEYRRFVNHVIQHIKPLEGSKILEIGPGPGWAGIWLLRKRTDLVLDGLEASPDMIRVATANAQEEGVADRVRYFQGVVENMEEIADNTYDFVFSRDSLHHWQDPVKGFREIARVVKPEGKVYIQDSRRDLGLRAKFIVNVIGPLLAGNMAKYWKTSIAASYTPVELQWMIRTIPRNDWTVKSNFLEVSIEPSALNNS